MEQDYTPLLHWLSFVYFSKLPGTAHAAYSKWDFFQEAKIAELECRGHYDPKRGIKFITYLGSCVKNRLATIVKKELKAMEAVGGFGDDDSRRGTLLLSEGASYDYGYDPERIAILAENLRILRRIYPEVVDIVLDGIPDKLFYSVNQDMRLRRFDRGLNALDGNVRLTQKVLKEFFDENLWTKTRLAYYNMYIRQKSKTNNKKEASKMAEVKISGMDKLKEIGAAAGVKPKKGESAAEYQGRIMDAIYAFDSAQWDKLDEDTQHWYNDRAKEEKAVKAELKKKAEADKKKKAASKKSGKGTAAKEKKELATAKKKAKEAASADAGKGFRENTIGAIVVDLVKKAGKDGIVEHKLVKETDKACKKADITVSNMAKRVHVIVTDGAKTSGRYGGLFTRTKQDKTKNGEWADIYASV